MQTRFGSYLEIRTNFPFIKSVEERIKPSEAEREEEGSAAGLYLLLSVVWVGWVFLLLVFKTGAAFVRLAFSLLLAVVCISCFWHMLLKLTMSHFEGGFGMSFCNTKR